MSTNARSTAWLRIRRRRPPAGRRRPDRAVPLPTRRCRRPGSPANATEAGTAPAAAAALGRSLLAPGRAVVALLLIDLVDRSRLPRRTSPAGRWSCAPSPAAPPTAWRATSRSRSDIAARLVEALAGARTIAAAGTEDRERARILAPLPELAAQGRPDVADPRRGRRAQRCPAAAADDRGPGGRRHPARRRGHRASANCWPPSRYAVARRRRGTAWPACSAPLVRSRAAARRAAELLACRPCAHGARTLPPEGRGTAGAARGHRGARGPHACCRRRPGRARRHHRGRRRPLRSRQVDCWRPWPGGSPTGRGHASCSTASRCMRCPRGRAAPGGRPTPSSGPSSSARTRRRRHRLGGGPPARRTRSVPRHARRAPTRFVRLLPEGYDDAAAGAPLSGGELQRLGLARAFAHAGRLLVLDDATSSLDTVTERQVERALAQDVRPGTRLVVAHRISSAARADLVIWLEDGRVRAVGPARGAVARTPPTVCGVRRTPNPLPTTAPADGSRRPSAGATGPAGGGPLPASADRHAVDGPPDDGRPGAPSQSRPPRSAPGRYGAGYLPPARRFLAARKRALAARRAGPSWSPHRPSSAATASPRPSTAASSPVAPGPVWSGWPPPRRRSSAPRRSCAASSRQLADLVEPLRDALVTRARSGRRCAGRSPTGPRTTADSGRLRLTHQTEIARDSFAGLVLTAAVVRLHRRRRAGRPAGAGPRAAARRPAARWSWACALFLATLRPDGRGPAPFLDADEARRAAQAGRVAAGAARRRGLRRGTRRTPRADAADHGRRGERRAFAGPLGRATHAGAGRRRANCPSSPAGGHPVAAAAGGDGGRAGRVRSPTWSSRCLPALHTLMTALGAAGTRLLVVLDRFVRRPPPGPVTPKVVDPCRRHPPRARRPGPLGTTPAVESAPFA